MSTEFDNILFDMPKTKSNTIKVIGVGGVSVIDSEAVQRLASVTVTL